MGASASVIARSIRLGLTGGIGSGKSTVAQMLASQGAALIDADALSRAATAAEGVAIEAIRTAFGPEFIDVSGALDRDRMRTLVFEDPSARSRLEGIVHPAVGRSIAAAAAHARESGHGLIVYDIPLLTESSRWACTLDAVLVVDCLETTQVQRVQQRSGLAIEVIQAIMASQSSRARRRAAADIVLFNDGITLAQLDAQVRQIGAWFGL
ncbi:MAG: dephospho-CoA kinase [Comamonas sp. SCN 65-56]|uniref:dephospho-CoA kinase n=1 Tax=Comamonas sp. SCN 65-56 TaxID=1660095 RepID=UPI00086CCC8C|nr:dephospho-CoA kinase [Comamonas sp. SCN 65-56]ODS92150.1 MAG: dephospho-CoA kinase [Comamonas sp. SCN 65-56]